MAESPRKRNMQDATLINIRALKARVAQLERAKRPEAKALMLLTRRMANLERRLSKAGW